MKEARKIFGTAIYPTAEKSGILSERIGRGVGSKGTMQYKVRHHRIRLYPYDMFPAPRWSFPPISPGPTPLARQSQAPQLKPRKPPLRKIHLIPIIMGSTTSAPAS
jgi:hypothetical protein